MSNIENSPWDWTQGKRAGFQIRVSYLAGLLLLALWLVPAGAQGQDLDEEYLRIYAVIQEADSLRDGNQAEAALAKYREAQVALNTFQRAHRDWNTKAVTFRANYLAQKIAKLSEKPADSSSPGPGAATTQVKLLENGAEPRAALRLHPKPDEKQTVAIVMKVGTETKVGEMQVPAMKLPAMNFTLQVAIKSVSDEGDITYDIKVEDASVAEEAETMPQIAEALKASMAGLKGVSGTGTCSSRGLSKGIELNLPQDADPQSRHTLDQLKETFFRFVTPFPEEPVGIGAKWEVKTPIKSQGMTLNQTATYELTGNESEKLMFKTVVAQNAANQKVESPAMPGQKVDVSKMEGQGTGTTALNPAEILPTEASFTGHSEASMSMNIANQKQSMLMKLDVDIRLNAK